MERYALILLKDCKEDITTSFNNLSLHLKESTKPCFCLDGVFLIKTNQTAKQLIQELSVYTAKGDGLAVFMVHGNPEYINFDIIDKWINPP
ncbi:hypothetical protein ACFL6I_06320 [candidate division KSB1 bacterium]